MLNPDQPSTINDSLPFIETIDSPAFLVGIQPLLLPIHQHQRDNHQAAAIKQQPSVNHQGTIAQSLSNKHSSTLNHHLPTTKIIPSTREPSSTNQPTNQATNQPTDKPTSTYLNQSQPTNQPAYHPSMPPPIRATPTMVLHDAALGPRAIPSAGGANVAEPIHQTAELRQRLAANTESY